MEDKFLGDLIDWTDGTKAYVEDMISKAVNYEDIVIFGAGIGGKKTYEVLEQNNLLDRVRAFSDNNPEKTDTVYLGIRVIKPNCIEKQYPRALILISSTAFDTIKNQLVGYGINEDNVYYFQPAGISMDGKHDTEFLRENIHKFDKVYQSLKDQKSKDIYRNLLNYRVSKNPKWLDDMKPLIDDEEGQYFDGEILRKYTDFRENGGVVDVGAYVGDTLESFFKRYPEFMGNYYCFEADDEIYSRLCRNIETKGYKNVIPLKYAAWNEKGELCFDTSSYGRGNGSRVSNIGTMVKCDSIDNLLGDKDVAFIKMDIEGAEKNALIGAENVIKKNKPILAVCIYHKQEDFFEIPLLIDSMVEDKYEFYVRQYRYGQSETVLYAMPKSRRR